LIAEVGGLIEHVLVDAILPDAGVIGELLDVPDTAVAIEPDVEGEQRVTLAQSSLGVHVAEHALPKWCSSSVFK
jgi:hypothetical protein